MRRKHSTIQETRDCEFVFTGQRASNGGRALPRLASARVLTGAKGAVSVVRRPPTWKGPPAEQTAAPGDSGHTKPRRLSGRYAAWRFGTWGPY